MVQQIIRQDFRILHQNNKIIFKKTCRSTDDIRNHLSINDVRLHKIA